MINFIVFQFLRARGPHDVALVNDLVTAEYNLVQFVFDIFRWKTHLRRRF